MAEKTLKKRKNSSLPVVLIRPSIIGCSYEEPSPGWTDTFSAAGGITIAGSLGIINYVCGDGDNIADLIPVDIVSNLILTSSAIYSKTPGLQVIHCGTSHLNPISWY